MHLYHDPDADTLAIELDVPAEGARNIDVDWIDIAPGVRALIGVPHITKNVVDPELYLHHATVLYRIEIDRINARNTGDPVSLWIDQAWKLARLRVELRDAVDQGMQGPPLKALIYKLTQTTEEAQDRADIEAAQSRGKGVRFSSGPLL